MLTPEEQKTQDAYAILAAQRNKTYANPEVWKLEYEQFCTRLPAGKVLDLGCGSGRDALLIKSHQYIGLDLSEPMLEEARKLAPQATFIRGNLYSLPFPDKTFDGVWAAASLLHTPRRRIREALQEVKRVLKDDGLFFSVLRKGNEEQFIPGREPGTDRFFCFWEELDWHEALWHSGFLPFHWHKREIAGYPWLVTFADRVL
jgi:ubiquinone/menaquinone biosynthesis C-methylase UbiE